MNNVTFGCRNENQRFKRVVEKLERSPVCQRLPLRSFLILPFQRITRIKLLVQVGPHTHASSPSWVLLTELSQTGTLRRSSGRDIPHVVLQTTAKYTYRDVEI